MRIRHCACTLIQTRRRQDKRKQNKREEKTVKHRKERKKERKETNPLHFRQSSFRSSLFLFPSPFLSSLYFKCTYTLRILLLTSFPSISLHSSLDHNYLQTSPFLLSSLISSLLFLFSFLSSSFFFLLFFSFSSLYSFLLLGQV